MGTGGPIVAIVLSVGLSACISSVADYEITGGSGSGGNGGAGASSGVGGVGNRGGGDPCVGFEDVTPQHSVFVRIHNNSGLPVYIAAADCEIDPVLALLDSSRALVRWTNPGACGHTCEKLQQEPEECPEDVCAAAPIIAIPDAAYYDMEWDGTVLDLVEMPLECHAASAFLPSEMCDQRVNAADGVYSLGAVIHHGISCDASTCGACEEIPGGACRYYDQYPTGDPENVDVTFAFPAEDQVDIYL